MDDVYQMDGWMMYIRWLDADVRVCLCIVVVHMCVFKFLCLRVCVCVGVHDCLNASVCVRA